MLIVSYLYASFNPPPSEARGGEVANLHVLIAHRGNPCEGVLTAVCMYVCLSVRLLRCKLVRALWTDQAETFKVGQDLPP